MAHLAVENHKEAYKYGMSKNKANEYLYSGAVTLYGFYDTEDIVATSGAGFVFEPFKSEDLTKLILQVYNMKPEERITMGLKGEKYIRKNHRREVLTDKLEEILFNS